ncbi:glycoside hydrolase family 3 C-terminal domain-containing protein [Phocaeicola barnesiae]|uniref:glycoside hydrolase family 3 C-terminal domain-containing protein n=1 Tax=Phocaeicola barnesiae TaxID=376804 RepID=UPI001F2CFDF7|nr:glycoside hydrolase family 3 C-terminal domain-containing protein [Phocaeicola barnesiae]MCF2599126.1 glycoside hydrolase family 3 C-terminal domain-containing protein [Phocaeicola barnesiae]MDM8234648.1 glycoside hydrolase family 3 C-terminal domain-containing protein [Phocaeicola barnesiae]MDM8241056.1 glycoside hydrolase family 3 C-terminal domain-containing protein [Phocaeicola barnesiae]MDM8308308.1 glycoside hydrolase family 3 C-terminal domain-containing protein [Phocaeicola barnesiae
MKKILVSLAFAAVLPLSAQQKPVYLDESKPIEERVEDALPRLTLKEKIALVHAQSKFSSAGVPRLGIPEFWMTDGPHGVRPEVLWDEWDQAGWTNDSCVAFPALTCLAATWNPEMSLLYGQSIGEEARYRNKTVLLGPGVNIYRTPLNGRNFEYMGEDPYLSAHMVVPYIQGVQQNGVAACVKHFALNNHEVNRHTTNVIVDDRALYEIYLPAFKAAVQEGKAWAIMGSYNLYKGQHCCHNQYLLNDILKGEWGFDGVVISDWGGAHDTDQAITNGLDMEFGSWTNGLSNGASNAYDNYYLAMPYLQRIQEGKVGTKELDDKVRRILRLAFRTTMNTSRPWGAILSPEHYEAARRIGEEGIVLLQNEGGLLPINLDKAKKIAVIGENAIKMMTVGGGSSSLKVQREISPLDGIRQRVGNQVEVVYARGYVGDASGEYNGVVTGQNLKDDRTPDELIAEAVKVAADADYVIFIGGLNKSANQDCEDTDRAGLGLPYGQDDVIQALAKVNRNLIVVNISGNAVAMPWVKEVPAIVQDWYLGSEAGSALAAVLVGDVNPSGKLPFTFPVKLEDNAAYALGEYTGVRSDTVINIKYNESIFVGYRWADKQKKSKPLFAFGHGLSYTTFEYGKPVADAKTMSPDGKLTVKVTVKNTGSREGQEVVQLYIADKKSSLPRPLKELKGFKKIKLTPGESKEVSFVIDKEALSFFDDTKHAWIAEPGKFEAIIAASAADVKGVVPFELK